MIDTTASTRITRPAPASSDRRTRLRLRELCDEVLASYRLAAGRDVISADDRAIARELLPSLAR